MYVTCYKQFDEYAEANRFARQHAREYAKLFRTNAETAQKTKCNKPWCVKWYQKPTYVEETKEYWRNQRSTEAIYLADMAR